MILFLSRNSLSYFQSYKDYFVAIYLIFLGFPVGDLLLMASSSSALQRIAIQGIVTSGSLIAIIWGYVATKLYVYPETFSPKRLISRPFRPIFLAYALYLLPMIFALIDGWVDPLAITSTSIQATYPFDNITLPSSTVSVLLVGMGLGVVTVFTSYPLAVLSRRRALVRDREVRRALRLIASSFGVISLASVLGFGLLAFGQNVLGPANFLSVILIIVAVQAFRKPSFLKTFLGVVQELADEAKTLGNEGLRVIVDYDDFIIRPLQKFVNHLTDPRWTSPDHHLHVLMAFNSTTFRGEEASLAELERKIRTLDLSEALDTFSSTVGLSHDEISGRKLLLEFDPQGDYERVFKSLLAETASNS